MIHPKCDLCGSQENRDEEIKAAYAARGFLRGKVMNEEQF